MTKEELEKMEKCRRKLNSFVVKYGTTHEKTLKASRELEKHLDKYSKEYYGIGG